MDSVGAHEPKKRRLPPWMMGAATSNQVREENKNDRVGSIIHAALDSEITLPKVQKRSRKIVKKSSDEDKEMRISEEVCAPKSKTRSRKVVNKNLDEDEDAHGSEEVCPPKLKRRSKRIQKGPLHEDEEANADDSCILVKCDSVKRKRKNSSANASDVHSIGNEKFIQISAPQKKKRGNVNKLTPNEASSSCTGREILMEDLIGIAQEYVNADSHTEQQFQRIREFGPEEKRSAADTSSDEPASSIPTIPPTECSSAVTDAKSISPTSSEPVENNNIFSNISRTGDPAQDMLNLLLGPLLMKPVEESKKTLNNDYMPLDRPVQNQSQKHIVDELAPLVKKKTSLKDKVAMFLE
ncbi:hypothetical protein QQ045_013124 [Rhodiola kirilowii]